MLCSWFLKLDVSKYVSVVLEIVPELRTVPIASGGPGFNIIAGGDRVAIGIGVTFSGKHTGTDLQGVHGLPSNVTFHSPSMAVIDQFLHFGVSRFFLQFFDFLCTHGFLFWIYVTELINVIWAEIHRLMGSVYSSKDDAKG